MLLNISGRTDIVQYYTPWLLKRLDEWFCYSRNPLFPKTVYRIDLNPQKIDCMVFCSKNYQPILPYIKEINNKYRILCHYTITAYWKDIEPWVPDIDSSIETLLKLSEIVWKEKVIWRYDPLLFTQNYNSEYLLKTYEYIADKVHNHIQRALFSFVERYKKLNTNMPELISFTDDDKIELAKWIWEISRKYNIYVQTCGTDNLYEEYWVHKSWCVSKEILEQANNVTYKNIKPIWMRKWCHCIPYRDIWYYDTCLNWCKYCYATKNHENVGNIIKKHNPESPLFIWKIEKDDKIIDMNQESYIVNNQKSSIQQSLF